MSLTSWIGVMTGLLTFSAYPVCVAAVLRGKVTLTRLTWWVWSLVVTLVATSSYSAGAGAAVWQPAAHAVGTIAIALLAFRWGKGGHSKTDVLCLVGSSSSIILWKLTGPPVGAVLLSIVSHAIAAFPLVKANYEKPEEDPLTWKLFLAGSLLNLFTVHWEAAGWVLCIFPVYQVVLCGGVTFLLTRKRD